MERRPLLRKVLALCLVLAAILPYTPIKAAENVVLWKSSETGSDAINRMGINLGKAALGGIIDSTRNPGR